MIFFKAGGEKVVGGGFALCKSVRKCIEILITEQEMSLGDALDHFGYNVSGSYVGEKTPIWCEDMFEH